MSTALHWATLVAYLLGSGVFLAFVITQRRGLFKMGQAVLGVGFALHTLALAAAWVETGALPAASLRQSLDLFSWGIMGATLAVNLRHQVMILGAVSSPICVLLLLAAAVLPRVGVPTAPAFKSLWIAAHVFALMAGYGLLFLTALGAIMYLLQDRAIRGKELGLLYRRLPPLGRLDQMIQAALMAGFVLMTLGLILGAVYAQMSLGSYWRWDPKEVWALITWLLYAGLIHTRLVQGWRGRRGAWLTLLAFAALVFTFIGAGLALGGYHSFEALPNLGGETAPAPALPPAPGLAPAPAPAGR
ncbi:MAG: cytochrome c biogenesis protein CcsA [Deltaproteobacteria bacterium]|nr:cytochrome c biogenesis protein CcsA [Deltaproteobacteria bacterium]